MTTAGFQTFNGGCEPPLPLLKVGGRVMLDTGRGPTLAFKDIGQQIVAYFVYCTIHQERNIL